MLNGKIVRLSRILFYVPSLRSKCIEQIFNHQMHLSVNNNCIRFYWIFLNFNSRVDQFRWFSTVHFDLIQYLICIEFRVTVHFFPLCIEINWNILLGHCDCVQNIIFNQTKTMNSMIHQGRKLILYLVFPYATNVIFCLCVCCRHNSTFHFNQMNKFQLMLTASNDTDILWKLIHT